MERRFVDVAGRRVHYRRIGEGPPVVMLHAVPGSSQMLLDEMHAAAPHFTCFALDMPGFGDSDALPGGNLSVGDLAEATAAAMKALALPCCPVFGAHAGAIVALELGLGWPESVSGLVLDCVPIFTDEEVGAVVENAVEPTPPDPLGAHFTPLWMRASDQFGGFPSYARGSTPEAIQLWVMMYYSAYRTCMPACRAIWHYGPAASLAAKALSIPAVFMAGETDMLFGHLDRLPPLKPNQQIVRVTGERDAKNIAMVGLLRAMPPPPPAPLPSPNGLVGCDPAVQFLDSEDGQLFVRCYGDRENPAVVLLHDAPGTGLALEELARSLAGTAYVILPDLPANGQSDAPDDSRNILEAAADAVGAIADTLALDCFTMAAVGCGCAVAALFALREDPRLASIVVQDMPATEVNAPDIPLSPDGAHWLTVWRLVRDKAPGRADADWLHDQSFALMRSRQSYHRLPSAAYKADTAGLLKRAKVPVLHAEGGGTLPALIRALAASLRM